MVSVNSAEIDLHHNESPTGSTTSGEKVLILQASPQGTRKGPEKKRNRESLVCEKLVALLPVLEKLEKKAWEQRILFGLGREQGAARKGGRKDGTCSL